MRLVIIGAGGHGQVVYETAQLTKAYEHNGIIFLDDRYSYEKDVMQKYGTVQYQISGECRDFILYINDQTEFYPAFGNNELRLKWEQQILEAGGNLATIVHPSSSIAKSVHIHTGSVVLANAIVNTGSTIGRACIINVGAIVEHGCVISDGCHVNSGAIVMAENHVPELTKIESGVVVPVHTWY